MKKYILHINDSGFEKDKLTMSALGNKIPLISGSHSKQFDTDIERLTETQKKAYDKLKKKINSKEPCLNPEWPLGTDLVNFKKGWKLEVVE